MIFCVFSLWDNKIAYH